MVPVYGSGFVFGDWVCTRILGINMCVYNPTWVESLNSTLAYYTGLPAISLWSFIIGGNILGIGLGLIFYPIFYYFFVSALQETKKTV